ncbi:hypothetical protein ACFE04_012960 [Oxalis oulophora]
MTHAQLSLQNSDGDTALSIAAIVGNLRAAKEIVQKHESLTITANNAERIPLLEAARHGHKDMILYLLPYGQSLLASDRKTGVLFINFLINANFFDIALDSVLKSNPSLATVELHGDKSLLSVMANNPSLFELKPIADIFDLISKTEEREMNVMTHAVISNMKARVRNHIMRRQALKLLHFICQEIATQDYTKASSMFKQPLLSAARLGNHKVVKEIMRSFPHAVQFTNSDNHNIFDLAVLHRWKRIYDLINEMGDYKRLLCLHHVDTSGNNILHLAANLASPDCWTPTRGPAFQMQRELSWYKKIEKLVPASFKEEKNLEGKTPPIVFTESHRGLVSKGDKWMKEVASSCSIVGVLIAGVVFAAAITVPGGSDQVKGYPLFLHKKIFLAFAISNAIALFSAFTSILIFLSITTDQFEEGDFLDKLPTKFLYGYKALFISISSMMVGSGCILFLVFCKENAWMIYPIGTFVFLLIYFFIVMQLPLIYWDNGSLSEIFVNHIIYVLGQLVVINRNLLQGFNLRGQLRQKLTSRT